MPVLTHTAHLFTMKGYVEDEVVERALGMVSFQLEGEAGEKVAMSFDLWMAQRVFDCVQADEMPAVEQYMRTVFGSAGEALLALAPGLAPKGNLRVKREQNTLFRGFRPPGSKYVPLKPKL